MTTPHDESTASIAAGGDETLTFTIDRSHDHIDAIVVAQEDGGDATTYDVEASTDEDFTEAWKEVASTTDQDPANDPTVLDNGGNGFSNFSPHDLDNNGDDRKLHVKVTVAGGTGNIFHVRVYSRGTTGAKIP